MGSIVLMIVLFAAAIGISFVKFAPQLAIVKRGGMIAAVVLGLAVGGGGAFGYNDSGYCQHIRTIFGTETSTCNTGWYFAGWGKTTAWPHEITVAHTSSATGESSFTAFTGSIMDPYRVRLADNWVGDVTQTTRFAIPQDNEQFLEMVRKFRSPERLINTTLRPAVTASLDSVANMFTMEEYYAGGKRDQFKSEYKDAVEKGRARVRQTSFNEAGVNITRTAPSDSEVAQDTSDVGDTEVRKIVMEKIVDRDGNVMRVAHDYNEHGIVVSSAILENLDPDDVFEQQIQARKEAASRRIVAREQRLEQEEQRLLAIQEGETNIAKRQAAAKVEQIQRTTDAETEKRLALIDAEKMREEAEIARQTAEIQLARARIDAESVQVTADAEAYQKEVILQADGALAQKLEAWVKAQQVWADAASKINVPATVIASGGAEGTQAGSALGTVDQFMQMMMVKTARDLQVDPTIRPVQ
jgi:regulator of protease activity HflC (stomatin/prohibitin superfamily)